MRNTSRASDGEVFFATREALAVAHDDAIHGREDDRYGLLIVVLLELDGPRIRHLGVVDLVLGHALLDELAGDFVAGRHEQVVFLEVDLRRPATGVLRQVEADAFGGGEAEWGSGAATFSVHTDAGAFDDDLVVTGVLEEHTEDRSHHWRAIRVSNAYAEDFFHGTI